LAYSSLKNTQKEAPNMMIPHFWAEARVQQQHLGKPLTVRRFGWSQTSELQAQTMADERAQQALQRIVAGEQLARREAKSPYNGADGVPIREEIVSEHGDTVVTRNAYGARCLNTPNVFFADIDFELPRLPGGYMGRIFCALWLGAMAVAWALGLLTVPIAAALLVVAFLAAVFVASAISQRRQAAAEAAPLPHNHPEAVARARVQAFLASHPGWGFRLYRTPAGLRLMATHQTMLPQDPEVALAFEALGTDPLYTAMCLKQQCFRARLTAKPWRIGVHDPLRPRPGVWPIAPQRMAERATWVQAYEKTAASFAACRFIETLGHPTVHFEVAAVQALHDAQCQATSTLEIA
jgi:hypothetical protein